MISHKHKCIFIHIPKTAGTSVEKKLGLFETLQWGAQDHRTIKDIQPMSFHRLALLLMRRQKFLSGKRLLKEKLKFNTRKSERVSDKQFNEYFKFTIVRNPWARVYSSYRNVTGDPRHGIPQCDFITFLREYPRHWALKPQTYWIRDFNGNIPLDSIVRFENISNEMPVVFRKLGMEDTTLPHLGKSPKRGDVVADYRAAYNTISFEIIAERYREEIALFGYEFE